jgi:hypothetical protein
VPCGEPGRTDPDRTRNPHHPFAGGTALHDVDRDQEGDECGCSDVEPVAEVFGHIGSFCGRLAGVHDRAEEILGSNAKVATMVGGGYLMARIGDFDVPRLPWWWFSSRSIRDRQERRPPDPRNVADGYVDHVSAFNLEADPGVVGAWVQRVVRRAFYLLPAPLRERVRRLR